MVGLWFRRKLHGTRVARNGGKLHGNISRNGYGNAIIGRYGGCFEEGEWWVYGSGESCAALERLAMVEG